MDIRTENRKADIYFRFMKNWDNETKKDLIIKLAKSIDNKSKKNYDFSSCFGAWIDDRSADEIIKNLRVDRLNNDEIEDL